MSFWDHIPPKTKQRMREVYDQLKDRKVGDIVDQVKMYTEAVSYGADPIEAMHGHLCGPKCMHWEAMSKEQKERLKKAPWNQ